MKVETRTRKLADNSFKLSVVLISENETESHALDLMLGDCRIEPIMVNGELRLSDGYGEHYVELWKAIPEAQPAPREP